MTQDAFGVGLGAVAVRFLFQVMSIDAEWSWGHEARGFHWIGRRLQQTIRASEPFESRGLTVVRLTATTAVADDVESTAELATVLDALNRFELGSRWIYDAAARQVLLHCGTLLYDETAEMRVRDLAGYGAMQVARAEALLDQGIASALGGRPADREHPALGARREMDGLLGVIDQVFVPGGAGPSRFQSVEEFAAAEESLRDTPFATLGGDETGIAAEVALGDDTSLIELFSEVRHPVLGSGLLTTLRFRIPPSSGDPADDEIRAALLVPVLNRMECRPDFEGQSYGAWHTNSKPGLSAEVAHSWFTPNVLFRPGRVRDTLWAALGRAIWLAQNVAPDRDALRATKWDLYFRLMERFDVPLGDMN